MFYYRKIQSATGSALGFSNENVTESIGPKLQALGLIIARTEVLACFQGSWWFCWGLKKRGGALPL